MNLGEQTAKLTQFRQSLYGIFNNYADVLMNLIDALSSNTTASSVVELSLNPPFERGYSALFKGIANYSKGSNNGRIKQISSPQDSPSEATNQSKEASSSSHHQTVQEAKQAPKQTAKEAKQAPASLRCVPTASPKQMAQEAKQAPASLRCVPTASPKQTAQEAKQAAQASPKQTAEEAKQAGVASAEQASQESEQAPASLRCVPTASAQQASQEPQQAPASLRGYKSQKMVSMSQFLS